MWLVCCALEATSSTSTPGGDQVPDWEAALADAPMRMIAHEDISVQSLRGMENNSQLNRDLISHHVPALLRGVARDGAGTRGGALYRALETGDFVHAAR